MRRRSRKTAGLGAAAVAIVVSCAATVWACVPVATVAVTPASARPGQEVTVSGVRFLGPNPVTLHLHSHDGPVLATMEMPPSANTLFKTTITVPPDTKPGPLVVVATQEAFEAGALASWGVPARAVITVLDADGNAPPSSVPAVTGRSPDVIHDRADVGLAVLIALGVAAVALLVVGAAALLASRRSQPRPAAAAK